MAGANSAFTVVLYQSLPHSVSTTHRIAHGSHAITNGMPRTGAASGGTGALETLSSFCRSLGEVHTSFGRQMRRNPIRHAIDTTDAPMSTIHGLMKFEIRYCGTANDTPV